MMAHTRFCKPPTVRCLLPLLLGLGRAAASAQAPAAGKAKGDRLVLGLMTPVPGRSAPVDQWHGRSHEPA